MGGNQCDRCGRELISPTAQYGWRCALKMGVSSWLEQAGDGAWETFMESVELANTYLDKMGINHESIDHDDFVEAVAKYCLAMSAGATELADKALDDAASILQKGKPKHTLPFMKYLDARDIKDYLDGRYTTDRHLDGAYEQNTAELQRSLIALDMRDRFGQELKEDGKWGPKTEWAFNNLTKTKDETLQEKYPEQFIGPLLPKDSYEYVMDFRQIENMRRMEQEAQSLLTAEQKIRLKNGGDIYGLLEELDPVKRQRLQQLGQEFMSVLSTEQKNDLMFLNGAALEGVDLGVRVKMLNRLKSNGGNLSYEEVVASGMHQDEYAKNPSGKLVRNLKSYAAIVEAEYHMSRYEMSFVELEQKERLERSAVWTAMIASSAGIITKGLLSGPTGALYGDNVYDNLEKYGTSQNFKGSDYSARYAEDAGKVSFDSLDDFVNDPSKLNNMNPTDFHHHLKTNGYNPTPLSKGSTAGVSFEQGGGFKVNWGGDRILQYHPGGGVHSGSYWKVSSGPTGTVKVSINGEYIP